MKKATPFIIFLLLSAFMVSCNTKKIESLESEKSRLQADSISRDSILNEWFTTFNVIEDNLAEITGRQKYIANAAAAETPRSPDVRERIRNEIATINDIMIDNQERLAALKEQIQTSNIRIRALEETIAILSKRVEEKDVEIAGLKGKLANLNIEKDNLNKTVAQLEQATNIQEELIREKEQAIDQFNEVWYVVGTSKYLKDNGFIEKTGMLGSTKVLSSRAGTGMFTQGDMRELSDIVVNSEKATLITVHPEGSYEWIREDKVITSLKINDPVEFWKTSKFCVVETK